MLKGILSFTPTSLASVELVVLSFCLVDIAISAPVPRVITPPMCDFMSLWTANDAPTLQYIVPVLSHPSTSVSHRCFITRPNLLLSSMSGDCTLASAQKRNDSL